VNQTSQTKSVNFEEKRLKQVCSWIFGLLIGGLMAGFLFKGVPQETGLSLIFLAVLFGLLVSFGYFRYRWEIG